jgi:hypothetical protein
MSAYSADFQVTDGLARPDEAAATLGLAALRSQYRRVPVDSIERRKEAVLVINLSAAAPFVAALEAIEAATPASQTVVMVKASSDAEITVRLYCQAHSRTVFRMAWGILG